jgi:hypothetical protein
MRIKMRVVEIRSKTICKLTAEEKSKAAEKIKKLQKEGEKLVKGMFEFTDAQGGWLDFSYRFYPGEPIRTIHIAHGEICDVPRDLAKHLNNVYKKVRVLRENADTGQDVVERTSRTRFIPMDMLDDELNRTAV